MCSTIFSPKEHSILSSIDDQQSALAIAKELQIVAAKKGFDWPSILPVFAKLEEEIAELKHEIMPSTQNGGAKEFDKNRVISELGDVLFCCVNLSRFIGVESEDALGMTNKKFIRRFQFIEKKLFEAGENIENASLESLDSAWDEAKSKGL